jgi:hypothetical protein
VVSLLPTCRIVLMDPMTAPLHSPTRAISVQRALSWWAWR